MSPILLQVEAPALKQWLEVFAYLIGIVTAVVLLWKALKPGKGETKISGQPIKVEASVQFAPLEDHQKLEQDVSQIRRDIHDGFNRLDQKRSTSIAGVHELVRLQSAEIGLLRSETAAVKAQNESQTRQIHTLDGKVDHLPEKIKNLLLPK